MQLKTVQELLSVFQFYAPDSSYGQALKDEFYSLLQQQINRPPRKSRKIIIGDFNAKVGTNGIDMYPDNCGKYGVKTMDGEGERLNNFCAKNSFAVMNTVYKQKKNRLVTLISPDGRTKNQIDYIMVPTDQKALIKKCRVFNSGDISSDHSLLMAKYTTFLLKVKHYKQELKRFDISKLKIEPIYNTFKIHFSGKFEPWINDISNQNIEDCL